MVLSVDEYDKYKESRLTNYVVKLEELIDRKLSEQGLVDWPEMYVYVDCVASEKFSHTTLGLTLCELNKSDRATVRKRIINDYAKAGWHVTWDNVQITTRNSRIFRSDKVETCTTHVLKINKS